MPHFLRIHYLCDYCCYEWSLFSLDRGGFQGLNPMPHFLRIHYLCDYCFYEWSLSSLDRGSFQVLNRKRDEDGLGNSLSKHLPPTYIITFPLVEIKPSKQFWQGHPIYKKLIQLDLVNGLVQPVSGLIQLGLEQKRVNSKWF